MNIANRRLEKSNESKKQRKSMTDPFVERIARIRTNKGKKVSDGMVKIRSQKSSESQKAMLEVETLPWMRIGRDEERKGMGTEDWRVNLLR